MKLEVGMYVRTLNGIVKIDKIQDNVMKDTKGYLHYGDFVKASYNIIDILEVGDYVNRHMVIDIMRNNRKDEPSRMIYCEYGNGLRGFYNEGIKSVITHEQMEQMEYKVGE